MTRKFKVVWFYCYQKFNENFFTSPSPILWWKFFGKTTSVCKEKYPYVLYLSHTVYHSWLTTSQGETIRFTSNFSCVPVRINGDRLDFELLIYTVKHTCVQIHWLVVADVSW